MPRRKPRNTAPAFAPTAVDELAVVRGEIVKLGEMIAEMVESQREIEARQVVTIAGIPVTGAVLQPAPGDLVVVSVQQELPKDDLERLRDALTSLMAQHDIRRWILLTGGMTLEAVPRETIEQLLVQK